LAKGNYWTEAEFIERFIAQYQLVFSLSPLLNALFRSFLVGRELKFLSHKVHALKILAIAKVVGNNLGQNKKKCQTHYLFTPKAQCQTH
jgi:hypothetical protein